MRELKSYSQAHKPGHCYHQESIGLFLSLADDLIGKAELTTSLCYQGVLCKIKEFSQESMITVPLALKLIKKIEITNQMKLQPN